MYKAVNRPVDLSFTQWLQLYTIVLEFSPDLIIELGRGYGNSTCVFTEAVNKAGKGRVISIGYDSELGWEKTTLPHLQKIIDPQWLEKLHVINQDILKTDFAEIVGQAKRVLLFWDAHAMKLAQYLLANLFPILQKREHLIIVHDITDAKNTQMDTTYKNDMPTFIWINNLACPFEEIIPIIDFISRNGITYDTPAESVVRFLREDEQASSGRAKELMMVWNELVGSSTLMSDSHMIYFDINNKTRQGIPVFPHYDSSTSWPEKIKIFTSNFLKKFLNMT